MTQRKTMAIWQPYFLGGGAEAVALWTLVALGSTYDIALHTLVDIDLDRLNTMYGTALSRDRPITAPARLVSRPPGETVIQVKPLLGPRLRPWIHRLIANVPWVRLALIHWSLARFRAISADYDLVMSTYNAVDLGRPGLQYLHWVYVVEQPWAQATPAMKLMLWWFKFSPERMLRNVSLTNSIHTAQAVQQAYGLGAQVVYPPVTTDLTPLPWAQKEQAFVCSGRVVVAKYTHRVIEILAAVRRQGFDIKLYITGGGGGTYSWGYGRKVRHLATAHADWVQLYYDLPHSDYLTLLTRCRYGLHHKPEPFGIAVAEMVQAGMIPFVTNRGGQIEIVNGANTDIIFQSAQEAVDKIVAVLANPQRQITLLDSLQQQRTLFSLDQFVRAMGHQVARAADEG
ncbi:glycosyltransferase [Nodosilinea sp. P-1105]|uniref:glycosyltransferase n=1 Tax=Nodosilinea sp. P-1105 TaxID=2546229 RepID=UPI00146B4DB9|nr:glycosyltransferase [Nodosilinea sp. P-1105]NMF84380.1 glycosyltransferase family 1 protein [Nodosilinea sp. P-1105]